MFEHLSALLSSAPQYSILLIERAVFSLLRLCQLLADKVTISISDEINSGLNFVLLQPSLRDQVYVAFDLLAGLPQSVSNLVGEQVMAGLILVLQKHEDILRYKNFCRQMP